MPLEEGHRGDIDEHILASLSEEPLPPHLDLISPGGVFHHLDDDHTTETADESDDALNNVDDQSTQHVDP